MAVRLLWRVEFRTTNARSRTGASGFVSRSMRLLGLIGAHYSVAPHAMGECELIKGQGQAQKLISNTLWLPSWMLPHGKVFLWRAIVASRTIDVTKPPRDQTRPPSSSLTRRLANLTSVENVRRSRSGLLLRAGNGLVRIGKRQGKLHDLPTVVSRDLISKFSHIPTFFRHTDDLVATRDERAHADILC